MVVDTPNRIVEVTATADREAAVQASTPTRVWRAITGLLPTDAELPSLVSAL